MQTGKSSATDGPPNIALWLALLWCGFGFLALLAPLVLLGLDLARGMGALLGAAALALLVLPVGAVWARATASLGPLVLALILLLYPLEGWISPPNVLMALLAWAAAVKAVLAARGGPGTAGLALPFVVSLFLLATLLAGWACGRFWLLAAFLGIELLVDARAVAAWPLARQIGRRAPDLELR